MMGDSLYFCLLTPKEEESLCVCVLLLVFFPSQTQIQNEEHDLSLQTAESNYDIFPHKPFKKTKKP